jgi:outer membrane protein assembly factor BamE (lipoprotein component of BamABCDE complex)
MKRFTFGLAIACLLALTGCLVTSTSKTTTSGNYVPEQTFDRIEPGKTTAAWVKATLGEPSCKTRVETADSEIWKWNYTETRKGSGTVLFLFAGSSNDEKSRAAYVEIKDGVVTKKWRA